MENWPIYLKDLTLDPIHIGWVVSWTDSFKLNFAGIFDWLWFERNRDWSCLGVVRNGRQLPIFGPRHHSPSQLSHFQFHFHTFTLSNWRQLQIFGLHNSSSQLSCFHFDTFTLTLAITANLWTTLSFLKSTLFNISFMNNGYNHSPAGRPDCNYCC